MRRSIAALTAAFALTAGTVTLATAAEAPAAGAALPCPEIAKQFTAATEAANRITPANAATALTDYMLSTNHAAQNLHGTLQQAASGQSLCADPATEIPLLADAVTKYAHTVTGKGGVFATQPFLAAPVVAMNRQLEQALDVFFEAAVDAAPEDSADALKDSAQRAQDAIGKLIDSMQDQTLM
ncbi:hypothetical protein G6045_03360 [Streptomyces sp. YC504]|uniref:Uncharacterized protein n=1 Tax=Streptomyces mesophilus TaxID=1775132 RepID=A0A6G4XBH0_9ACTN|nr:hypothetical protein [Streptomyces mesophilus]NGO74728.1 hypothetical protein [Streptomyces mesophilus]